MSLLVASYAKSVRESKGLRTVDVGTRMGLWKQPAKGAQRVAGFERTGRCTSEFFRRLRDVLGLDESHIRDLLAEEERRRQAWLDEPVPMELVVRMMPAFYVTRAVPAGLGREEAIAWALGEARREGRLQMCLRLSRRERVWIGEGGRSHHAEQVRPGTEDLPSMRIGNTPVRIVQGGGASGG